MTLDAAALKTSTPTAITARASARFLPPLRARTALAECTLSVGAGAVPKDKGTAAC